MRMIVLLLGLVLVAGCGFEGEASSADYITEVKDAVESMEVSMEDQVSNISEGDMDAPLLTSGALLLSIEAEEAKGKLKTAPGSRYESLNKDLHAYMEDTIKYCLDLSQNPTEELKSDCLTNYRLVLDTKEKIVKLHEKE